MNQERAVPVMLIEDFQTGEEIDVDMVSRAAVWSRRRRLERWPESAERRRSSVTLRRAVSVLWHKQKARLNRFKQITCGILERKVRLEMDRKLFKSSGLRPGFFEDGGVTAAVLRV